MSAKDKGKEGGEGKTCRCPNLSGRVAFVLFTEAHVTVPVTLGGIIFQDILQFFSTTQISHCGNICIFEDYIRLWNTCAGILKIGL